MKKIRKDELFVGQRVQHIQEGKGTIYSIRMTTENRNCKASIKLDSGHTGGGEIIQELPYSGCRGCVIGIDGEGYWECITDLSSEPALTKIEIGEQCGNELEVGNRVVCKTSNGEKLHGFVYRIGCCRGTVKLDSGRNGAGEIIKEKPYCGTCGWCIVKNYNLWYADTMPIYYENNKITNKIETIPNGGSMKNVIKKVFDKTAEADAVEEVYGPGIPDTIISECVLRANKEEIAARAVKIKSARDKKAGIEE